MNNQHYSNEDVIAVAGVTGDTLQNWLSEKFGSLNLSQQNPGRGKPRSYSNYDVAAIALAKKMVDAGIPLKPAFRITAALKRAWESVPGGYEAHSRKSSRTASWLFIVSEDAWKERQAKPFPLTAGKSTARADGYVAILAIQRHDSNKHPGDLQDVYDFFEPNPVTGLDMGAFLRSIAARLGERSA